MAIEKCTTIPLQIISDKRIPRTRYIGSKEQLIAAGFADESHFPEGRKRIKHGGKFEDRNQWYITKMKGGRFELDKWHDERRPPQKQKSERCFSSPEDFRNYALACIGRLDVFIHFMGGGWEIEKYGEATMWIDDESMQEIIDAHNLLIETVEISKIVCAKKKLHLSIVK